MRKLHERKNTEKQTKMIIEEEFQGFSHFQRSMVFALPVNNHSKGQSMLGFFLELVIAAKTNI